MRIRFGKVILSPVVVARAVAVVVAIAEEEFESSSVAMFAIAVVVDGVVAIHQSCDLGFEGCKKTCGVHIQFFHILDIFDQP